MGNNLYAADGTAPEMAGFLRLARPGNCVMSAVGVGIGGLVAVGAGAWGEFAWRLLWAGAAAAAFTAGGNALNDLYDRETDRVNHPERPLTAGEVTVASAKSFVVSAFTIAASLAFVASPWAFVVALVNIALMASYEAVLKARGAPGNLVIAYLVGSLFLFAGVSVFRSSVEPVVRTGILAALAFFTTLGREITKDIEDMHGDVDRRTLPHRIGARRAGFVAALALLLGVALSLVPFALGVLSLGYAILVIPADGMFIYAALHSAANPSRSQRVTKYAMIVALVAFLAGAFA
jgi:geranylgeranylglycerol-phosphate geranylgeranyltransferase